MKKNKNGGSICENNILGRDGKQGPTRTLPIGVKFGSGLVSLEAGMGLQNSGLSWWVQGGLGFLGFKSLA